MNSISSPKLVCVAVISGAHGIKGEVKIRPLLENIDLLESAPLLSAAGKELFSIKITGELKNSVIARISTITDRNAAELLKDTELFIPAANLPPAQDGEFYHSELIGLAARGKNGITFGTISNILNFGAGDILEITLTSGEQEMLPFSAPWVEDINTAQGFVIVNQAEYLEAKK